jgi:hypothetical protein
MIALAPPAEWDWVALGTLALAVATFTLALYNRSIVKASQEQLETARQDLALAREQNETAQEALAVQTAPFLTNVPRSLEHSPKGVDPSRIGVSYGTVGNEPRALVSVPFRNVGNGAAIITSVQVMIGGRMFDASPRTPILPPGESAHAGFDASRRDEVFDYGVSLAVDGQDFSLVVGYADAAGSPHAALRLDLHNDRPGYDHWHVRQLHVGETAEAAMSHPHLSSLPL